MTDDRYYSDFLSKVENRLIEAQSRHSALILVVASPAFVTVFKVN